MEYSRGTVTESEGLETTKAQPREAEPRVTINQTVLINQSTNTGSPENHDITLMMQPVSVILCCTPVVGCVSVM